VERVAGVILAGGLSRRMGGTDKSLCRLDKKPLIGHVIERLHEQAAPLALNANGDPSRFSLFGLPVIADATRDFAGPLAGVLAGMRWAAKAAPDARFIVTAACDTPFFPSDLVERLLGSTDGAYPCVALAASGGKIHPVFGLWPIALAEDLVLSLEEGTRKVLHWTDRHPHSIVDFAFAGFGGNRVDPFFNANTPEDLAEAERLLTMERTP
jgi:molybdopterin-guanine dinucleotide biosynthesis protein A